MPEVCYRTVVAVPRASIWDFVKDINNWAPLMTGYQAHEIRSDTHSVWTLKGDVGILSRVVRLDVHITEWAGPDRVRFTLQGLNEAVSGGGSFELEEVTGDPPPPPPPKPWLRRLLDWVLGGLFRARHGTVAVPQLPGSSSTALTFRWTMEAGGATAPLVNAMLEPALEPAAEHLARSIAARVAGAA